MNKKTSFTIFFEKIRLQKWFKDNFLNASLSVFYKSVRNKDILVNGKKTSVNAFVYKNDIISVYNLIIKNYHSENIDLNISKQILDNRDFINLLEKLVILYEDKDFIVIDKPYGVSSQKGTDIKFSIIDIVQEFCKVKIYPVHRLDKNTTGVMIFGKNYDFAVRISNLFLNKKIHKEYLAIVHGRFITNSINLQVNISKISGKWGEKMKVSGINKDINEEQKYSSTRLNVIKEFDINNKHFSLINAIPITGRKHQIRAHCDFLGNSIVGDDKYFSVCKERFANRTMCECYTNFKNVGNISTVMGHGCQNLCKNCDCGSRMMLHCAKLSFEDFVFTSDCNLLDSMKC